MKLKFVDIPKKVLVEEYHDAIDRMVNSLSMHKEILSIYQVGGINTPGISDIDFYVVFHDNSSNIFNPVNEISESDRYLFSHNLFGTSKSFALKMEQFTFFGNYKLLHGDQTDFHNYTLNTTDRKLLEQQIALEYLIKAWLSIRIQLKLGYIKTRGLLLHSKAILFDLKFLNIHDGQLMNTINNLMQIRNNWYSQSTDYKILESLCYDYCRQLEQTIFEEIKRHGFFMDPGITYKTAKRINISESSKIEFHCKGITLPQFLTTLSSFLRKIQYKFSYFDVGVPISQSEMPAILKSRRNTIKEAIQYNRKHLPAFLCGGFPLQIFLGNSD